MSEECKEATWATEADRKRDMRHRKISSVKSAVRMWWHGVFWRTLHATKLARRYSVTMCRLRLYRKFPDGRCMWCGVVHEPTGTSKEGASK